MSIQTRLIDQGRELASGIADKFIRDDAIKDLTKNIITNTSQSLHDLHKSRLTDQSLQDTKPMNNSSVQDSKPGFWQKAGGWFKNLWGKIRKPAQDLIGRIPLGIGNAANQIIDRFNPAPKTE